MTERVDGYYFCTIPNEDGTVEKEICAYDAADDTYIVMGNYEIWTPDEFAAIASDPIEMPENIV